MKRCIIFHNGEVLGEFDEWQHVHSLPEESYINCQTVFGVQRFWYVVRQMEALPRIDIEQVPKQYRALLLLLS